MHFSFVNSILIFFIFFVFLIFKVRCFKSSVILFGIVLICCFRIKFKPVSLIPSGCYKIERIIKANQKKTVFIGKGKKKVLFTLKTKGTYENIYYPNDILEYKDGFRSLPSPKKLDGFVYADYLKKIGIDSVAYPIVSPKVLFRDSLSIIFLASKFRRSIITYLLSFSKVTSSTKGLSIALLTGDKSFLNKRGHELFRDSGVIHILAISGLHVGILYVTLCFLFSRIFRLPEKIVFYCIGILLIVYAFITGLSPSVIRAVLMFILIHYGKSYQKSVSTLNIVFSSAVLILFYDPDLIKDIGFQLSYSAVIGIVLMMQYSGCDDWVKIKYLRVLWRVTLVNVAAFLFTAPIISFHFGVINFTSIWASLLVVPIITIGMYLGLTLLVLSFNQFFSEKIFLTLDYLFLGVNKILNLTTEYFHFSLSFFSNSTILVVCFSVLLYFATKKRQCFSILVFICLLISFLSSSTNIQILKLNTQVQLKYKNEVFYLNKGDSIHIKDFVVVYQKKNIIILERNDLVKEIDFNVNNYKFLSL